MSKKELVQPEREDGWLKKIEKAGLAESGESPFDYDEIGAFPALKYVRRLKLKTKLIDYVVSNLLVSPQGEVQKVVSDPNTPLLIRVIASLITRAARGNKDARDFVLWMATREKSSSVLMRGGAAEIEDVTGGGEERAIVRMAPMESYNETAVLESQRKLKSEAAEKINRLLSHHGIPPVSISD